MVRAIRAQNSLAQGRISREEKEKMIVEVQIPQRKKRKKYLAELIGEKYREWRGKAVLLCAPTGLGKTTFVLEVLLPDLKWRRKKMLILCNRRLLRLQYWNSLVGQFEMRAELDDCVTLMTYQELAEKVKNCVSSEMLFRDYEVVVCDECHYFYADSDFNGFGTYALLQAIAHAGVTKELIFMSATMEEVRPLIVDCIKHAATILSRTRDNYDFRDGDKEICFYNFSCEADFDRVHCFCAPDLETVCRLFAESSK